MAENTAAKKPTARGPTTAKKPRREKKKPGSYTQPLSAYNIFFRHERGRLIELSQSGKSIHDHPPAHVTKEDLRRFMELSPNPAPGERKKRLHRKTHGAVSFIDLSKIVGNNWKALDATTKKTFQDVAHEIKVAMYRKQEEERKKARQQRGGLPTPKFDTELYQNLDPERRSAMMQADLARSMSASVRAHPPVGSVATPRLSRLSGPTLPLIITSAAPRPSGPPRSLAFAAARPSMPARPRVSAAPRSVVEQEVANLLLGFSQAAAAPSVPLHAPTQGPMTDLKPAVAGSGVQPFTAAPASAPTDRLSEWN